MSRPHRTKVLAAEYREQASLSEAARARLLRSLHERLAAGAAPLPEADVPAPALIASSGLVTSLARIGWPLALVAALGGVVVIWSVSRSAFEAATEQRPPDASPARVLEPGATAPASAARSSPLPSVPLAATEASAEAPRRSAEEQARTAARAPARRPSERAVANDRAPGAALPPPQSDRVADVAPKNAPPQVDRASARSPDTLAPDPSGEAESLASSARSSPVVMPPAAATTPEQGVAARDQDSLAEEMQLMRAARVAMQAGQHGRALSSLAEHAWRYPRGHMAEARDVTRILALCDAGRVAEARSQARQFLQQRNGSPFAARVRASCGDPL